MKIKHNFNVLLTSPLSNWMKDSLNHKGDFV